VALPLLILDDLGMRKLPLTAVEDLLEIVMRRYERASTIATSIRPVEDWSKLIGDDDGLLSQVGTSAHHQQAAAPWNQCARPFQYRCTRIVRATRFLHVFGYR